MESVLEHVIYRISVWTRSHQTSRDSDRTYNVLPKGQPDALWSIMYSAFYRPVASIGEKACNSVREDYLWNVKGVVMNPFFTNPGYLPNGSWPTHSSLAPSCTLGCAGCAITGNSVELLFWPEQTAAPTANVTGWQNNTASLTTSDRGPVTAVVGTYTFTSPTVYVSYDTLYAANSCGPIGDVYNNTILPLANTNHLSSLMLTAQNPGLFGPVYTYYYSASFNLSDLVEPVPQSVYDQAPACQSQSYKNCKVGGGPCGFVCATDKPYAPIIAVPVELTDLHPEWKSCTPWYGGLYDPPIALTQAPTADVITPPGVGPSPTTTPAAEAPPIQGMPPSVTAPPVQEPTTKAPAQPTPTPDTEPESPRPPQNGSPGSSEPEGQQPGNGDQPSNESPSNGPPKDNQASDGQPEHDSNPSSPNNPLTSNDPGSSEPGPDQPDLPVVITQPTQSDGFIFSPEQSPDPPVNHGSPTNALEVLTQALNPGVGSDADSPATSNPSITPPPGNVVLSPPDIPVSRSGSDYFVGTNQLPPGSATTVYGVEVSNDPNADGVIIADSTTISLAANEATTLSAWSHGAEPLAITRQDNEHIVVAEHTLTQGEFATFRDVSVSVGPEGQVVVLGSTALSLEDGGYTTLPNPNPTAVNPEILRGPEAYVVAGVSVHAGEVATINGVAVSIGSGGEVVVDGKTTMILGMGETTALPVWTASGHQGTRGEGVTVVKNGMTFVNGEVSVAATGTDTSMASRASRKTDEIPQPGSATRAVDDEAPTATETGAAAALMAVTSGHLLAVWGLLAMML
ncbi:unnamed protein product [Zymoseptoria tritici ST99CH_1E4]|uniref:Uncharacterized protein n=1 Tax=Zymoseptoria tritici ST99CH_1E4 TaxID=1276532 RepID=A0A2H1H014_ZYMTR|nr:unnamed protein product [Zymoseptoria tritici ST99CH_1E4]